MAFPNLSNIQIQNLVLNKISQDDKPFIENMFNDADIKRY